MNWVWFIIIGIVAGFLAGAVVKGRGFGLIGNLICAFLGAVLLLFLLGFVGKKS